MSSARALPLSSRCPVLPLPFPRSKQALSVVPDFPILDISQGWNHSICGLWCLACFSEQRVFTVHPRRTRLRNFLPFCGSGHVPLCGCSSPDGQFDVSTVWRPRRMPHGHAHTGLHVDVGFQFSGVAVQPGLLACV